MPLLNVCSIPNAVQLVYHGLHIYLGCCRKFVSCCAYQHICRATVCQVSIALSWEISIGERGVMENWGFRVGMKLDRSDNKIDQITNRNEADIQ